MEAAVASLIGGAVGALSALAGGYLTGRHLSQLERDKLLRNRADDHRKSVCLALAELARRLAAGTHEISWVTWRAKYATSELTAEHLSNYDRAMGSVFPDMVGSRVELAGLDRRIHAQMEPLVYKLYALDEQVALAAASFNRSPESCIKGLSYCYDVCRELDHEIIDKVAGMISTNPPGEISAG
jgi:hypothetical protein